MSEIIRHLHQDVLKALSKLNFSFWPDSTFSRLRKHKFTWAEVVEYVFLAALPMFWLVLAPIPFLLKLLAPPAAIIVLVTPITGQLFVPASPVVVWALSWYASQFIPSEWRPSISVSILPTLESVLYGGNISDILTRYTNPVLDVLAWLPYGVIHFTAPIFVAIALWLWRSDVGKGNNQALKLWARAFGYMNLAGVLIQLSFPCSPPWYELIYGLTPADYSIHGSPGGLARIDALFHSSGYTDGFGSSPLVFGAFPSLHSGSATIEALFISHFFPRLRRYIWCYALVLYWSTMYLTQHYLVDVVAGTCLAVFAFYFFLPNSLRTPHDTPSPFASTTHDSTWSDGYTSTRRTDEGMGSRSPNWQVV